MIVTKKALARRTVLRGLGASIALPLLDGMVPAFAAIRNTAAQPTPRLSIVYTGNGAVMADWTPELEGPAFEFSPILAPLAPFRDRVLVVSGLDNAPGLARPGEPAGGHGRIGGAFPDRRAREADRGCGFRSGCLDRPDRRDPPRPADAAVIARGRPGVDRVRRRVRRRVQLRLRHDDLLAHADDAAADGEQPAGRLRAALRRQSEHRSSRPSGAHSDRSQHSRFRGRQGGAAQANARHPGWCQARRVSRCGARRRTTYPNGRGAGRP